MEKKYQVFISSTYTDLRDERQGVSKAVLDLGHIPVGMELFPATNASQLDYIKKVIDDCDYYVVIVGGRYGSADDSGISYTEQEFDYARAKSIPVLAFIHEDPLVIPVGKSDIEAEAKEKLSGFVKKLKAGRVVKFWSDSQSLAASVITSLTSEIRDNPGLGWRRATDDIPPSVQKQLSDAKASRAYWFQQYQSAEAKLKAYANLEESELSIKYSGNDGPTSISMSGEALIREIAPSLISGLNLKELQEILTVYVRHQSDPSVETVDRRSAELAKLLLTVFEIAEHNEVADALEIAEKNKYLLQAAFKPLKKVLQAKIDFDDEIPF